jgi:hypothetical protein
VSEGWKSVWVVCRFYVQRATVTLRNNEHDDTEPQQQRIRFTTTSYCGRVASSAIQSDPLGLCSASWASYNKRTMEAGLWGIWAFGPDAK